MSDLSDRLVNAAIETFGGDPVHTHDASAAQAVAAVLRELDRSGRFPPLGHGDPTLADLAAEIEEDDEA